MPFSAASQCRVPAPKHWVALLPANCEDREMTSITTELEQEAEITGRVLARMPEEKLTWKPHVKSMTLGQLALHTAGIPGAFAHILSGDSFQVDPEGIKNPPQPANKAEI